MILEVLSNLFSFEAIIVLIFGTILGIIFGAIPGLTGTIGVSLLLPLSFSLDAEMGLLLLGGIYMGSMCGGSITAILLNIPGAPEATFTAADGFPMTLEGESQRALYHSIYACVFGGLGGVLVLLFFTPALVKIALSFGQPEMFLLGVAGLTVIGALAGGTNISKSFYATGLGVLVSCIGADFSSNINRFTFGYNDLNAGISLISVVLGTFAISEMILNLGNKSGKITDIQQKKISRVKVLKEFFSYRVTLIRATIIGILVGILPGVGGTTACFVAYGNAKTMSRKPELFGKGSPEGIIANESSNNAVVGSCLVPLLSLGIPGSGTAAIMLGALTVHGMIPGPELFTKHAEVAYTFMLGMIGTVVVMGLFGLFGVRFFSKIANINLEYIIPLTIVFSILGAYANSNNMFDVVVALVFALIAILLKKNHFPVAPMVLGVVLGPLIEEKMRISMTLASAKGQSFLEYLLHRPMCVVLAILVGLLLFFMVRLNHRVLKQPDAGNE